MSQIFIVRSLKGTDSTLNKKRTFPGSEIAKNPRQKKIVLLQNNNRENRNTLRNLIKIVIWSFWLAKFIFATIVM